MLENKKIIDLHTHSNISDGRFSPEEIIKIAENNNVGTISITDHDTIGIIGQDFFDATNIEVITGMELSSFSIEDGVRQRLHLLAYDFNHENIDLKNKIKLMTNLREEVNLQYTENLYKIFPFLEDDILYNLTLSKYQTMWKVIYWEMEKLGYSLKHREEIKNYCTQVCNYPIYENYEIILEEAIELIHNAGGKIFLAHPYEYYRGEYVTTITNKEKLITFIKKIKQLGIDGIECFHSEAPLDFCNEILKITNENGLLYTVGSDYHYPTIEEEKEIGFGINYNLCLDNCSYIEERQKIKIRR